MVKDDVQPSLDLYEPQRSDLAEEAKDPGKAKTKGKVTFALQKNTVRSQSVDEGMFIAKSLHYMDNRYIYWSEHVKMNSLPACDLFCHLLITFVNC